MSNNVGMGACCLSGTVHTGTPQGREEVFGGINTYVSEPADGSKSKSVVIISDIFGWELKNTRLFADQYAKAGFYVFVPDFHSGDSLPESFLQNVEPNLKEQAELSIASKAKNAAVVPTTLGPWLITHREGVVRPLIDGFFNTLRMTPYVNKIGAVGFCWGGRYAILQAHEGSHVNAVFAAHPSLVSVPSDFDPITKPTSLALGTKDSLLDEKSRSGIQEVLSAKTDVPTEVRIYEDQVHGFALRGDWSSEKDKEAMDEAAKQGVAWLQKHLS